MSDLFSKEVVPLYVALVWVAFWVMLAFMFRRQISDIADALNTRIKRGDQLTVGPVSLGTPPKELQPGSIGGAAVSDPRNSGVLPSSLSKDEVNDQYKKLIDQGYFLVHATEVLRERTTPGSGRYRVRVWVESYFDKPLDEIVRVTYRVWNDFKKPILSTSSHETNFDLWLSIYGEFPVLAFIELKDKPHVMVTRYIDLPGRPPD